MREPGLGPALDPSGRESGGGEGPRPQRGSWPEGLCTAGRGLSPAIDVPRPWWMILRMCPWTLATRRSWRFGKPRSGEF